MSTISFFEELYFCFESSKLNNAHIPVPELCGKDGYFGIIKVGAIACPETKNPQDFLFIIDCSGSMSDTCLDGRTKMQHIKHTLKNMVSYFCDKSFITITICVFDDLFETITNRTLVKKSNINDIYNSIDKIQPRGSTNIENALKQSAIIVSNLTELNTQINQIFMTDGSITVGSNDINTLKNLINSSIKNIFIGFGIDHDASLLSFMSNKQNTSYYFIDKIEKAGLVYGEILHSIMYTLLDYAKFTVTNALIYDYKSNKWTNELVIGNIVGETNKIYHIVCDNPHECQVILSCKKDTELLKFYISKLVDINVDYTKYIFRQRVLQLLYEINQANNTRHEYDIVNYRRIEYNPSKSDNKYISFMKNKINSLLKELKTYMEANHLTDDVYYKNLCNDLLISYTTLGTKYGLMFTSARQTSQGTQRAYTVTKCPTDDNIKFNMSQRVGGLIRNTSTSYNNEDVFSDSDDTDEFENMAYVNPTAINLMRDISYRPYDETDMEYDNILDNIEKKL